MRRHRLDDPLLQGLGARAVQALDQLFPGPPPLPLDEGTQPRLQQVVLLVVEDAGRIFQDLIALDQRRAGGGGDHRCSFPARFSRVRRVMAAATSGSATISSASPAPATLPGMPQTTEVASSCTRTRPPTDLISSQP